MLPEHSRWVYFDASHTKNKRVGSAKPDPQTVLDWIRIEILKAVALTSTLWNASTYIKYEIEQSIDRGNGLLGIDVSKIKDLQGNTSDRCGRIPQGYEFYLWNNDDGYNNMGDWIEKAARAAGR